jgi:hypothetical protein
MNKLIILYEIVSILIIFPHIGHILAVGGSILESGNKTVKFHHSFNATNANGIFLRDKASVVMNDGLSIILILNGIIGESIQRLTRVTSRGRNTSLPVIFNLSNHNSSPLVSIKRRYKKSPKVSSTFRGFS